MRHILRVVYEKISPMMKTSGKGNYSRWPNDRKMTEEPCRTCRWNLADNRLSEEHGDNRVHVKIKLNPEKE